MKSWIKSDNGIDIPGSIRLKARIASDSSDSSGFRIHDDGSRGIRTGYADSFFEGFHHRVLNIWIDSEIEIDTFDFLLGIFIKYWTSETVSALILASGFTGKKVIEISFNSEPSYTIAIDKTCDLSVKSTLRILTDRMISQFETFIKSIF